MAATSRVYLVAIGDTTHLVRAGRPGSALLHVAQTIAKVVVPTQDQLIAAVQKGVKVQDATAQDEAESPQQDLPQ
jgi:hypothetical protein